MLIKKLELPNFFKSIRCEITKDPKASRYVQDKLYAHYCPNCHQVFIARFDWVNGGMSLRWKGNCYRCPTCNTTAYTTWDDCNHYYGDIGFVEKPGMNIPTEMNLALYEFKEKIKLIINSNCILFEPEAPENVTGHKVNETIIFDIKNQKTTFNQKIDDKEQITTEIGNPLDCTFMENSMLQYIKKNSRPWQKQKKEILEINRILREKIHKKLKQVKNYKLKKFPIAIQGNSKTGLITEPIINIAWRLSITDGPNLHEVFKYSEYNEENNTENFSSLYLPNITQKNLEDIMHLSQNGMSYPQAVLKTFSMTDTKSTRKMLANAPTYMLSVIKTMSLAKLDEQAKKQFKDAICKKWKDWIENRLEFPTVFYSETTTYHKKIPNTNGLKLFLTATEKIGQNRAMALLTKLPTDELNDAGNTYQKLTPEEKETVWKNGTSPKKIHDTCTELEWRHTNPNYNLDVPKHIINRLMMQKDSMKFFLPETYYDLHAAGRELHNCVGGCYPEQMKNGQCCIVLVADDLGKLKVCIELRGKTIVQAKLFNNKPVKENFEINQTINNWAKEKQLTIGTHDIRKITQEDKKVAI